METHGVTVRTVQVLGGPNLYASMPVVRVVLDIGLYEERPSTSFPGFVERLAEWLPGLAGHTCSVGRPGGFIERLQRGTYLAHIVEHVTLELQNLIGFDVTFGRARGAGEPGVYTVVFAYREETPAREAFTTALRLTLAAMHDEPFDMAAERERLVELADLYRLGPDEDTAIEVAGGERFRVLGSGAVYVVDGAEIMYSSLSEQHAEGIVTIHDVKLHVLGADDQFDLIERRPLRPDTVERNGKK